MEKYLMLANDKAEKLNLRRTRDLRQAFSSMEPIKSKQQTAIIFPSNYMNFYCKKAAQDMVMINT
jgi:hypothetical protein